MYSLKSCRWNEVRQRGTALKIIIMPVIFCSMVMIFCSLVSGPQEVPSGEEAKGTREYSDYERPKTCASCHKSIYRQWQQAMMSQAYTHHWDEIEYFDLAIPHGKADPTLKEAVDGCNGCHAPLAYLAGDLPPPRPAENSRANESVSCDLCHTITDVRGDPPVNFSYMSVPGREKYGSKPGLESPHHITKYREIFTKTELCASCHNEENPYGVWVKSTQIEWQEGPYSREGVKCFNCHMPRARGRSASMAEESMVAQHVFLGAHKPSKLRGVIEISMHAVESELPYDGSAVIKVELFNAKAGHKVPTGSVEDRIMWLDVVAVDSDGKEYRLNVDRKGFEGEEYTIATDELAYKDMGVPLGRPDFNGVPRDGIPVGNRIFRMPFLDEDGVMTIMQWNTRKLGVDYRIGPRETKIETYTWNMPEDIAFGMVTVTATLNYQRLVKPVADILGVPEDESEIVTINQTSTEFEVYD
jgi:nitrate/TMAO reductase-like tetraheme cytochrome c subunit